MRLYRLGICVAAVLAFGCGGSEASAVCDEIFAGSVPGYVFCGADVESLTCELWFQTPNRETEETCNVICGAAECVTAYDDNMRTPCTTSEEVPCDEDLADGVCVCGIPP